MRLYTVFVFLYLTDFTERNTVEGHSFCLKWQSFLVFLWLNNIPLHIYVCVYIYIYIYIYTPYIYIYHNFFIYSANEHVDCVYVLAIIYNASVIMGVQIAF